MGFATIPDPSSTRTEPAGLAYPVPLLVAW